ncbi:MAG: creatininase family protein [Pirellulaceae bacterium]
MKLAELRRPEVEALDKTNKVALVPLGSLEQHGEHLPLCTDSLLGEQLAQRVEAALPETVVLLPMQWLGSSHHHIRFPGTVSAPSNVYIEMIYHLCECLLSAGFRRIYLLLSHGGNDVPCREVLNRLALAHRDEADKFWIASAGYWALAAEAMRLPEMVTPGTTHACEYETSMVLSVRPDLVDLKRAVSDCFEVDSKYYDPAGGGRNRVHVAQPFEKLTRTGALGRPELGTAEKGERLFAAVVEELVAFVREFSTWERKPQSDG